MRGASQSGSADPFAVFNDVQDHLLTAARVHVDRVVMEAFVAAIDDCADPAVADSGESSGPIDAPQDLSGCVTVAFRCGGCMRRIHCRCSRSSTTPRRGWPMPTRFAPPAVAQGADVDAYQGSWANRALGLQYELAGDVPLRHTPWVGTHNTYNSPEEMGPALSPMDANQSLTMIDQLRIDVRSIELDVHLFPTARDPQTGPIAPVVCHAFPTHVGCTTEKSLREMLQEQQRFTPDVTCSA
jgi:hypothetical protein